MSNKPPKRSRSFSAFSSALDESAFHSHDAKPLDPTQFEEGRGGANATPHEATEVERRLLAHERVLQALICHLAEDDPEILRQLKVRFGSGHDLGQYEQNYVSTDDYSDHFIRSVEVELTRRNAGSRR